MLTKWTSPYKKLTKDPLHFPFPFVIYSETKLLILFLRKKEENLKYLNLFENVKLNLLITKGRLTIHNFYNLFNKQYLKIVLQTNFHIFYPFGRRFQKVPYKLTELCRSRNFIYVGWNLPWWGYYIIIYIVAIFSLKLSRCILIIMKLSILKNVW